jgi:hypothetical protein
MDWKNLELLDLAETQRSLLRKKGHRLSFDCFNMKMNRDGKRCRCSFGHTHNQDVLFVLLGKCCISCKDCSQYDSGA